MAGRAAVVDRHVRGHGHGPSPGPGLGPRTCRSFVAACRFPSGTTPRGFALGFDALDLLIEGGLELLTVVLM